MREMLLAAEAGYLVFEDNQGGWQPDEPGSQPTPVAPAQVAVPDFRACTWDDLEILRAIDRLEQTEPASINNELWLMEKVAGGQVPEHQRRLVFAAALNGDEAAPLRDDEMAPLDGDAVATPG